MKSESVWVDQSLDSQRSNVKKGRICKRGFCSFAPLSLKSHVFMTVKWNLTARIDQILLKMTEAERRHTKRHTGTREFEQRPWIVNLRTSVSDPILHS